MSHDPLIGALKMDLFPLEICYIMYNLLKDFQRTVIAVGWERKAGETTDLAAAAELPSGSGVAVSLPSDYLLRGTVSGSEASSSPMSDQSPSGTGRGAAELPDEALQSMSNDFTNWTFKNVELLGERNREMAEQAVGMRGGNSFKEERLP